MCDVSKVFPFNEKRLICIVLCSALLCFVLCEFTELFCVAQRRFATSIVWAPHPKQLTHQNQHLHNASLAHYRSTVWLMTSAFLRHELDPNTGIATVASLCNPRVTNRRDRDRERRCSLSGADDERVMAEQDADSASAGSSVSAEPKFLVLLQSAGGSSCIKNTGQWKAVRTQMV